MSPEIRLRRVIKPFIFTLCLMPMVWLIWRGLSGDLGANPIEVITRFLGDWAMRILLVTLAVTPLRRLTGQVEVMRFRRLVGLFAFFYVALHVSSYVVVDQFFDWPAIWADIVKRLYISLGMGALVILAAMTATSTAGMIKRLGRRKWSRLHKGVYGAAVLAVIHFFMMRKGFQIEPLVYAGILAMLLGARLLPKRRSKRPARNQASST